MTLTRIARTLNVVLASVKKGADALAAGIQVRENLNGS
jgi:hypothetical protein